MPPQNQIYSKQDRKPLFIALAVIVFGVLISVLIYQTEPEAQREAATKRTAMLVKVEETKRGNFSPVIESLGLVTPAQEVELRARVSGELISIGDNFRPGELVNKGALLASLDDRDYQLALVEQKSVLAESVAQWEMEQGEQVIAEREYRQIKRDLPLMQEALVLRKPQLKSAQAQVDSAKAALEKARLDLERTQLKAPFDALIVDRFVSPGSQVSPGETVARLVGTERFWVEATIPLSKMPFLSTQTTNPNVKITAPSAWPKGSMREGRVLNSINVLDDESRLLRVLIEVENPLAINMPEGAALPLVLGSYVHCEIQGKVLENVVRLERQYLRKNDTAWVYAGGTLEIRDLKVVFMNEEYVFVSEGLEDGDRVVISNLARVREGAALRLDGEP